MDETNFNTAFEALTGYPPFPWQWKLYDEWFVAGNFPDSCNLPTGVGKTSVITIWLLALATAPAGRVPRRLVYVVNRRTVVDQATREAEKLREQLLGDYGPPPVALWQLRKGLLAFCASADTPLAISTLRGQFADNREWSADPTRPAVIVGTVDMIGSRLLFSGYGVGMKGKPLHAGFLGQDVLLVHDEAHLEPAFQELVKAIEREQREREKPVPWPKFRVMELTATSRGGSEVFELTPQEKATPAELPAELSEPIHHVWQRMKAKKGLNFHSAKRDVVAARIGEIARDQWKDSGKAILIFVRTVEDVRTVKAVLTDKKKGGVAEDQVQLLTGTLRGLERDALAATDPIFARFRPDPKVAEKEGTVFLVCTSAGEVGVDLSADHLVCDLTTLDSMAQRFGRVNRRGYGAASIDVVVETDPNPKPQSPAFEAARWRTKEVLERLAACRWTEEPRYDASPAALGEVMKALTEAERRAAFAPLPTILPVTDILFDAWALTSIPGRLPGRPEVEPYLHGLADWQLPETSVAWREEVGRITGDLLELYPPGQLIEDYPLRPHELLREPSYRAFKHVEAMAKRLPGQKVPVWLLDDDGTVVVSTVAELADKDQKDRINGMTVILPPAAGGLSSGMLDGASATANDVADTADRKRIWNDEGVPENFRKVRTIRFPGADEDTGGDEWHWFEAGNEGGQSAKQPVTWGVHVKDVEDRTAEIVDKLPLGPALREAVKLAAKFHDHGKRRKLFQTVLGNPRYPEIVLAKSGRHGGRVEEKYRHEFGSLVDVESESLFRELKDHKDLVLHLIATHHGRARPHFPIDEAFDPDHPADLTDRIAREVPRRFARLQRQYGRWGLAYLESLLRAADWAASANPSRFLQEHER